MSADRLRRSDDESLGRALASLHLRWPPPPDVTDDVVATIRAADRRPVLAASRLSMPSRRRTVLLIAAALLTLAAAAGAAKLLDIGAVTIERIPGRPTGTPGPVFPGEGFGATITRIQAEAALGTAFRTPPALGEPDAFWLQESTVGPDGAGPWVVAGWAPQPALPAIEGTEWGAVLMRFEGDADIVSKLVGGGGTRLDEVEIDGRRALWISGAHELELPLDGRLERYEVRGNVLVVQAGDLTLRLETDLPLLDAIELVGPIL